MRLDMTVPIGLWGRLEFLITFILSLPFDVVVVVAVVVVVVVVVVDAAV